MPWLRVKDLDFERREIAVRDGMVGKDRVTLLTRSLGVALQLHLREGRHLHQADLTAGWGKVADGLGPSPEVSQRKP